MNLSRENFLSSVCALAAFSIGGFLAMQTVNAKQNAEVVTVSEIISQSSGDALPRPILNIKSQASVPLTSAKTCNHRCKADVAKFQSWAANIDWSSEEGDDRAGEYAAYLRERPALRDRLISMAGNQSDDDFDRLLVASFRYLKSQDKMNLSEALMSSPKWGIRRITISLLTSQDVLTSQNEAQIVSLISNETDPRVVIPILGALGQSSVVSQKPEIMEFIHERVSYTQDPKIRGTALIAQTKLALDEMTQVPPHIIRALHSRDHEYRFYGVQATDLILSKLFQSEKNSEAPVYHEAKQALETLIYSEDDAPPDRVLRKADYLYLRYFE